MTPTIARAIREPNRRGTCLFFAISPLGRSYDGHVTFRSRLEPRLHDYQTVQFATRVQPGDKKNLLFEVVQRQGHNAKQNNVTLEEANIDAN